MKMKCQRCGHEWDYQGNSKWYTSCPRCKTSINVRNGEDGSNNNIEK